MSSYTGRHRCPSCWIDGEFGTDCNITGRHIECGTKSTDKDTERAPGRHRKTQNLATFPITA